MDRVKGSTKREGEREGVQSQGSVEPASPCHECRHREGGVTSKLTQGGHVAARRKVSTTGVRRMLRNPHHPAINASAPPAALPSKGTQNDGCQLN